MNSATGPDYGAYVSGNPDLQAAFDGSGGRYGGVVDFGRTHYYTHGQGEGRNLPMYGQTNGQQQLSAGATGDQEPFDPLAGFKGSGDYALMDFKPVQDSTNAAFSAKGMGMDGSALRGMWGAKTGMTQDAFYRWRGGLEGAPTGAAGAMASAGQQLLGTTANARQATAAALGSSYQQRANAMSAGLGALQGAAQWGMKRWGG
ncbi:MAG: hypothetical protein ACRC56_11880 [Bosea sp. (in: a-proteobacteria)]